MILPVNQMVVKRAERLMRVISSKVQRQRVSHVKQWQVFFIFPVWCILQSESITICINSHAPVTPTDRPLCDAHFCQITHLANLLINS